MSGIAFPYEGSPIILRGPVDALEGIQIVEKAMSLPKLLECLFAEIPDGESKTDEQAAIEAFIWRAFGEDAMSTILLNAILQRKENAG